MLKSDLIKIDPTGKYHEWLTKSYQDGLLFLEDKSLIVEILKKFEKHQEIFEQDNPIWDYDSPLSLYRAIAKFYPDETIGYHLEQSYINRANAKRAQNESDTWIDQKFASSNIKIIKPLSIFAEEWLGDYLENFRDYERTDLLFMNIDNQIFTIILDIYAKNVCFYKFDNNIQQRVLIDINTENYPQFKPVMMAFLDNGYIIGNDILDIVDEDIWKKTISLKGYKIIDVPQNIRTAELYEIAIKQNGDNLQYIDIEFKTKELCRMALESDEGYQTMRFVPKAFRSEEFFDLFRKKSSVSLYNLGSYIDLSTVSEAFLIKALQKKGEDLCSLNVKNRTAELCQIAVEQNALALQYVPSHLKTRELCQMAVQKNPCVVSCISGEVLDMDFIKVFLKNNGDYRSLLKYINLNEKITIMDIYKEILIVNGIEMNDSLYENFEDMIWRLAIQHDCGLMSVYNHKSNNFIYCPESILKDENFLKALIQKNPKSIRDIPHDYITISLCGVLLENMGEDIELLNNIPENIRNMESYIPVYLEAFQKDKNLIWCIPELYRTKEMYRQVYDAGVNIILQDIPMEFKKDLILKEKNIIPKIKDSIIENYKTANIMENHNDHKYC